MLARGVVVGLSFAGLKFILAARLWLLLISFFFPSEQTSFFSSCRFQNKFRENPSSPSAVRVVVDTKYNTHTFHQQHNNNNNMSDNEGGGAAADVDFNDDLFTCANVRFIQCYRIARNILDFVLVVCVDIFL